MSIDGDYLPSPTSWVRNHVGQILASGDTSVATIQDRPVVLLTMRGRRSGVVRKVPLMRVEHDGRYLAVASMGGAPEDPQWAGNLRADPDIEVMDGTSTYAVRARELDGDERAQWWERGVAAFPDYASYQARTERLIPLFVLEPR
jgi:deazaflavin-dependent oxidoreductase (nitroreductase family)